MEKRPVSSPAWLRGTLALEISWESNSRIVQGPRGWANGRGVTGHYGPIPMLAWEGGKLSKECEYVSSVSSELILRFPYFRNHNTSEHQAMRLG